MHGLSPVFVRPRIAQLYHLGSAERLDRIHLNLTLMLSREIENSPTIAPPNLHKRKETPKLMVFNLLLPNQYPLCQDVWSFFTNVTKSVTPTVIAPT